MKYLCLWMKHFAQSYLSKENGEVMCLGCKKDAKRYDFDTVHWQRNRINLCALFIGVELVKSSGTSKADKG